MKRYKTPIRLWTIPAVQVHSKKKGRASYTRKNKHKKNDLEL